MHDVCFIYFYAFKLDWPGSRFQKHKYQHTLGLLLVQSCSRTFASVPASIRCLRDKNSLYDFVRIYNLFDNEDNLRINAWSPIEFKNKNISISTWMQRYAIQLQLQKWVRTLKIHSYLLPVINSSPLWCLQWQVNIGIQPRPVKMFVTWMPLPIIRMMWWYKICITNIWNFLCESQQFS